MKDYNYGVIESVGGYEAFERLVTQGRQLHNKAIFDLFSGLATNFLQVAKTGVALLRGEKACYRKDFGFPARKKVTMDRI